MTAPVTEPTRLIFDNSAWNTSLKGCIQTGESPLALLNLDLDEHLVYASGAVVLTSQRLLVWQENKGLPKKVVQQPAHSWNLAEITSVKAKENFGTGMLDILGPDRLLARLRYTSAEFTAASKFSQEVRSRLTGGIGLLAPSTATVCPSCGAVLPPDEPVCQICKPTGQLPPAKSLLRLIRFAKPHFWMILLGFILTLLGTVAALITPYLTMPLIDDVLIPASIDRSQFNQTLFIQCMVGMVVSAILAWLLKWSRTYVLAWTSERVAADLRNETYAHLQRLSLEFFGGKRTGDLMSRIGSDTDRINNYITLHLLDFATDILMISLTIFVLLYINPWMALATLIPFPAIIGLIYLVRKQLRHGYILSSRVWGEMTSVLADTIPGIRVVKAFAQEQREIDRFRASNQHVLGAADRVNRIWSFFDPVVGLLTELGGLVIWIVGAWFVLSGSVKIGVLQVFVVYIGRFYSRLDAMSRMLANTQRAAASAHRIFEILDRVASVAEPTSPVHPGRVSGSIQIDDVKFQYGMRQVIKGVSLTIEPGEMIGLVGPSGAGKSTLVNLVCRFYDVVSGGILVDGVDIRSFPVEEYRRNIGVVLQEPFLFFGTVAENIAYAKPDATRQEIIEAGKASHAHEFIMRLTDGYDSVVGERGQSLSGGERQRISIARALLTNPRILILDEATSSVDTETEREIQGALDNLTKGRTTIAIAHRLSTLRNASRLVVMEDGKIVEVGTHDDLLARQGAYFRLHQAQFEAATAPPPESI